VPKDPDDVDHIYSLIFLSSDRVILLYGTVSTPGGYTDTTRLSFASIDFINGTYELVGNYYELFRMFAPSDPIFVFNSTLIVKCGSTGLKDKIYLFNVDTKLATFELLKSIDASDDVFYFNLIDGNIVFATIESSSRTISHIVDDFMVINRDYTLTKLEKTATCLKSNFVCDSDKVNMVTYIKLDTLIDMFKVAEETHGCWSGSKFFCFLNLMLYNKRSNRSSNTTHLSISTIPHLWEFEMKTKIWTEIRFSNYPIGVNMFYQFNVDCNGILTLLIGDVYVPPDFSRNIKSCNVELSRTPLRLVFKSYFYLV
jgi:hypothetical protein